MLTFSVTLYRFSFCPKWHYHATAEEAANCTELQAAFGPLKRARNKSRLLCSVPGCDRRRLKGRERCRECYALQLETRKQNAARLGDW